MLPGCNHNGVDEPIDGKSVLESKSHGSEMMDSSERQVPMGANQYHNRIGRGRPEKGAVTLTGGIMTMWTRWIQRGVLCGLVLGGLAACSMIQHPPVDQIDANDHSKLSSWYEQEATQLRQSAKDELAMAEAYRKNPDPKNPVVSRKIKLVEYYEALADMYKKTAAAADLLADEHRNILRGGHVREGN